MRYHKFERNGKYFVSVNDGKVWVTFTFLDWESQNAFCVALDNGVDVEEV